MKNEIFKLAEEFSRQTHGSTKYDQDHCFVMGKKASFFVPLSYLEKHIPSLQGPTDLLDHGFCYSSYNFLDDSEFPAWFEQQFGKKLKSKMAEDLSIIYHPDLKSIFESLDLAQKAYNHLREHNILINSKNLPMQTGEWYAKCIFGLIQKKSISQRGFDFYTQNKRVEVKVHWNDRSSPKGVKIKKSLVELSKACVIIYVAQNFTIRDICYLDSNFIMRKFAGKGHTIFLKDQDLMPYFFSRSSKHLGKVVSKNALMKFASPGFAMKLVEQFK